MKYLITLFILTGFLLTACAGGQKAVNFVPEPAREAQKLLQDAMKKYQRGCDKIALDYLFRAHELFSLADQVGSVAVCLNNMGNIYRRSGNIDDAVLFFDEAVNLFQRTNDPTGAGQAMSSMAAALLEAGRLEAAEKILDEAAVLLPPKSQATALLLNHRAILWMKKGDHAAAEKLLRQAAALVPDPKAPAHATINAGLGNLMLERNRYEEALEFFKTAYQADHLNENIPALADDLAAMATACLALEMFDEGIYYLKRSLKLNALTGKIIRAHNQFEQLVQITSERNEDIAVISHFAGKWLRGEAALEYCR